MHLAPKQRLDVFTIYYSLPKDRSMDKAKVTSDFP